MRRVAGLGRQLAARDVRPRPSLEGADRRGPAASFRRSAMPLAISTIESPTGARRESPVKGRSPDWPALFPSATVGGGGVACEAGLMIGAVGAYWASAADTPPANAAP